MKAKLLQPKAPDLNKTGGLSFTHLHPFPCILSPLDHAGQCSGAVFVRAVQAEDILTHGLIGQGAGRERWGFRADRQLRGRGQDHGLGLRDQHLLGAAATNQEQQ